MITTTGEKMKDYLYCEKHDVYYKGDNEFTGETCPTCAMLHVTEIKLEGVIEILERARHNVLGDLDAGIHDAKTFAETLKEL